MRQACIYIIYKLSLITYTRTSVRNITSPLWIHVTTKKPTHPLNRRIAEAQEIIEEEARKDAQKLLLEQEADANKKTTPMPTKQNPLPSLLSVIGLEETKETTPIPTMPNKPEEMLNILVDIV